MRQITFNASIRAAPPAVIAMLLRFSVLMRFAESSWFVSIAFALFTYFLFRWKRENRAWQAARQRKWKRKRTAQQTPRPRKHRSRVSSAASLGYLLQLYFDLENSNRHPLGITGNPDYIVTSARGLERYDLEYFQLAQFGALYLLKPA